MLKDENKLIKQVMNSDINMFTQNIFPKIFEKTAQSCYVQHMDAFAKLFEEQNLYKSIMEEMGRVMYYRLKAKLGEAEL